MKCLFTAVCVMVLLAANFPGKVSAADTEWLALFDGTNLDAWDADSSSPPDEWELKDGILSTKKTGGGWLQTRKTFKNFELLVEFRMSAGANSGIFLRAEGSTPHVDGLEVQLLDDDAFPDGAKTSSCGALMLECAPRERASLKAGEWQVIRIKCVGNKIAVKLNDKLIVNEDLSLNPERAEAHPGRDSVAGRIGLQNRGERVDFRKIEVKEYE